MFLATFRNRMSRTAVSAASQRTAVIGHHMMSTNASPSQLEVYIFFHFISFSPFSNSHIQPTVKFESNSSLRTYILNRPLKLNALDEPMLSALRPKIEVCLNNPLNEPGQRKVFFLWPLGMECFRSLRDNRWEGDGPCVLHRGRCRK
jgi:hypothetical protein